MIKILTITSFLLYLVTIIIIFLGLFYISNAPKSFISNIIMSYSVKKPTLSTNDLCYLSDGTTYKRDELRKLVAKNTANKSAYITENDSLTIPYISKNFANFSEFLDNSRAAVMSRRLIKNSRSIESIFRDPPYRDMVKPSCDGLWMEFGVFRGKTLTHIANWKRLFCGNDSQPVYGFDTFTGLPTEWRYGHGRGTFGLPNGTKIIVPSNVLLVQGLFIDTLPGQLLAFDREHRCHTPVSFVHIDCDIYDGTRDVFFLLGSRFVSGTVLIFDELFNYPGYEEHEFKALFEFLAGSNIQLIPVGSSTYIQRYPVKDITIQSFAFVVN